MNWSVLAIIVTVGLAQAGLVVGLLDRLFKAEMRILAAAISALKEELQRRDGTDEIRDRRIDILEDQMKEIQVRLEGCLKGTPRCST